MKLLVLFICIILQLPFFIYAGDKQTQICDCSTAYSSWISEIVRPFNTKPILVAALGRKARLGDLYDARSDHFMGISLYSTGLPGDAISSINNAYSTIDYIRTESFLEKFQKLEVQTPLSISFLGGLVSVSGSGNYLNQDKKSAKSAKASLVYRVKTTSDDLQIFSKSSKSATDKFLLENVDATHVVVGIEWGANVVLSLEETNTDLTNYKDIQRKLEDTLDQTVLSVTNSSHIDTEKCDVEKSSTFSLHLNSDIAPNFAIKTIKQSIAFMRDIRTLTRIENGGKGKIVNYILMPIQTVRKLFQAESNKTGSINEMDTELSDQFLRIFQEIKDSKILIEDAYDSLNAFKVMISEKELEKVIDFNQKLFSFGNMFRKRFADLLVLFRSGKFYDGALNDLVSAYEKSDYTLRSVKKFLSGYEPTMHKIEILNLLQSFNVSFMIRKTDKYKIIERSYVQKISFILADLNNVSSPFVNDLIKSVKAESKKREGGVRYYIEDVPVKVPEVEVYSEGKMIKACSYDENSSSCFHNIIKLRNTEKKHSNDKKEYVLLKTAFGKVIILDGNMREIIRNDNISEIANSLVTIVGDTFYNIDTNKGKIMSTAVENIMNGLSDVNWTYVGSFQPENEPMHYGVAVNNSIVYFISHDGVLYSYDTKLNTVTKMAKLTIVYTASYSGLAVLDSILYIQYWNNFYSFDGTAVKEITIPEKRELPGLFQLGSLVCRVGGNITDIGLNPDPVSCDNPSNETWTVTSYINQCRVCPSITSTESGIYILGGRAWRAKGGGNWINSMEVFKPKSKI